MYLCPYSSSLNSFRVLTSKRIKCLPVGFDFCQDADPDPGVNIEALVRELVDDVLCLLCFFHFLEHYPARTRLTGKQDRSRMNGQSLTKANILVLMEIAFK